MKICIKFLVITAVTIISIKAGAHVCNQKIKITSGTFLNPEKHLQVIFSGSPIDDSLNLFIVNYPVVYRKLITSYNTAENLKYSTVGKALYITFNYNSHKITAVYSLSGKIRYSITNLGESLPIEITQKLKVEYPAYSIFNGKDIRMNNETIYQVIIENSYEYRVINIINDETQEIKKLKK